MDPWGFDLAAYLNAGLRLVNEGSLYARDLVNAPFEPGPANLFYYAPPLGVALVPLTAVGFDEAAWAWWGIRVAALGLACGLMPVRPVIRALAFATVAFSLPALTDAVVGNVSLLLLLPLVAGWRWLDRPVGSIALAIAASIRPGFAVFLVWQLLRRRWRAAAWFIAAGVALVVLTLPVVGAGGYTDYLAVLGNLQTPSEPSGSLDLGSVAFALGAGELAGVARMVSIGLGVTAILVSLRRDRETSYMVTLGASLVLVPLIWDHYLVALVLPAAFLAERTHVGLIFLPLISWLPFLQPALIWLAILLVFLAARNPVAPARGSGRGTSGPSFRSACRSSR